MSSNVSALNGVQAAGTFQYDPNASSFGFDDMDLDYSTYPMGMGGSIFSGYGGAMPFAPGIGGNNQPYFDNMKNYQKFYVDYNIDQQKMQRNADLRVNASVEGIQEAALNLKDKILQNEQDQIPRAFQAYVDRVAQAYGPGTPQEVKSRALALYSNMNGGKSLIQDLRENSHSSATQGFIQSLTFGAFYKHSAEDNISDITGQPVGTGEKTLHNLGRLGGAATVGGVAYGITKAVTKGATVQNTSKYLKYFKGGSKAAIVGLIAGGLAATLSFLTGKVTT